MSEIIFRIQFREVFTFNGFGFNEMFGLEEFARLVCFEDVILVYLLSNTRILSSSLLC